MLEEVEAKEKRKRGKGAEKKVGETSHRLIQRSPKVRHKKIEKEVMLLKRMIK